MARIRSIKPEFFIDDKVFDVEEETGLPVRVAAVGLLCQADREGRFKWKPRRLKTQVLPFDGVDFEAVLEALVSVGYLVRYTVDGKTFGVIANFHRHQRIRNDEAASVLPAPEDGTLVKADKSMIPDARVPGPSLESAGSVTEQSPTHTVEGKGKERKGKEGEDAPADAGFDEREAYRIRLKAGGEGVVTVGKVDEWRRAFKRIDVEVHLAKMAAYYIEAPEGKRWTEAGYLRGCVNWLSRENERAPKPKVVRTPILPGEPGFNAKFKFPEGADV